MTKTERSLNKTTFITRQNRSILGKVLFVVCVDFFYGQPSTCFSEFCITLWSKRIELNVQFVRFISDCLGLVVFMVSGICRTSIRKKPVFALVRADVKCVSGDVLLKACRWSNTGFPLWRLYLNVLPQMLIIAA